MTTQMTDIALTIAGATGWTGRAIVDGAVAADGITLRGAVARSHAGQDLGTALGREPLGVPVVADVADALDGVDVLVEFTDGAVARQIALAAIERGVAPVIGSSGLTAADFEEIDAAARAAGIGAIAAGNFSVTAAMALAGATLAARHLSHWEIIDYAKSTKGDAPSGTAMELAERMAEVATPAVDLDPARVTGHPEARGATVAGVQIHSVRVPSFVVSTEVVFAAADERLSIRHDAGSSPAPYVQGVLLAVRAVRAHTGLVRGLDRLLLGSWPGDP
jgi:4-hydroxy-tetrahydrodipicolinate reductase